MNAFIIYIIVVAVISVITFILYCVDKVKAQLGSWRIKEAVLLGMGFLGGAAGALIAMNVCRHKTKHWYFWIVNSISLVLHIAIAFLILFSLT